MKVEKVKVLIKGEVEKSFVTKDKFREIQLEK